MNLLILTNLSTVIGIVGLVLSTSPAVSQNLDAAKGRLIGVTTANVTEGVAAIAGLDAARGALVESVVSQSAADSAGVKVGDIILEFDGRQILDPKHLRRVIEDFEKQQFVLTILRQGKDVRLQAAFKEPEDTRNEVVVSARAQACAKVTTECRAGRRHSRSRTKLLECVVLRPTQRCSASLSLGKHLRTDLSQGISARGR